VSLFRACDSPKLIINVAGFVRPYRVRHTWLDEWRCRYNTWWWASYTPRRRWLDWNIMQVIMISRLHAMYQQSRKVLAFLLVIFLPIRIANAVMTAIMTTQVAAGRLWLCIKFSGASGSLACIRGIHSLQHLSMRLSLFGRIPISGFHDLDTWHCMGGLCIVSRGLDCCKTLPWTATTLNRKYYRRLFYSVDENSRDLLCEVSS
jgi:hypothetical protein